jgi:LmbE family N-acetylglucosaminyl deacetylase
VIPLHLRPGPLSVLCLGAHSDDIEIGCGGLVLSLLRERPDVEVRWVVASAAGARADEAQRSADAFLRGARGCQIDCWAFRDGFFPAEAAAIKERFEGLKREISPDIVLTHRLEDRHQDHRVLAELTWNTFRDHLVLEYEIPKYEGDLGTPNVFVPLSPDVARTKIAHLMTFFGTQRSKRWFSEGLFEGLMRIRGVEAGLDQGFAEAFHARKAVLSLAAAAQETPTGRA